MIDLHSHLLPGLDDGSRSLAQSVTVLKNFVAAGVTDVAVTPHLRASEIAANGEDAIGRRDWVLAELRDAAPDGMRLHPGFEIMLDEPLSAVAVGDRRYALAGSRFYLVEFPITVVGDLATRILQQIVRAGVKPVVAHPERYPLVSPRTVAAWRDVGAAIQVDATTLTRPHTRGETARQLVALGYADILAADNHGDRRTMMTGRRFLEGRGAGEAASWLTIENPRAILQDRELAPVPKSRLKVGLMEWVRGWIRREA